MHPSRFTTSPSRRKARPSGLYPHLPGDGHDDGSQQGRKVVRGADAIGLSANRRDTYRLSYDWWQGVWNVGFRAICEDEDPTLETVASAK